MFRIWWQINDQWSLIIKISEVNLGLKIINVHNPDYA